MPRNFPHWIKAYAEHCRLSESPTQFHVWTAIATVAGALRRRVWIDQLHFEWTPNFYVVLVGPPGVAAKSTSIGTGMAMLRKVEGVVFGPQSATWQSIPTALEEALQYIDIEKPDGSKEQIPMSAITIPLSEMGTFLKTADTSMLDLLVDLWDGRRDVWKHKTKTTGETEVHNPWINIIGCTTPAWLRENFTEDMIGGGLASRIVFVYGEKKRRLVAYPSQDVIPADYLEERRMLVEDLQQIALLKGEYKLSPEALAWGAAWYEKHWNHRPVHMASDRHSGYWSRKQTHLHKVAMVVAAAQSDDLIIHRSHLEDALNLLESVEPHMDKVYESIGYVQEARHTADLIGYVKAYNGLSPGELFGLLRNRMSKKDFETAFKLAIEHGDLKPSMKDGKRVVIVPAVEVEPPPT